MPTAVRSHISGCCADKGTETGGATAVGETAGVVISEGGVAVEGGEREAVAVRGAIGTG